MNRTLMGLIFSWFYLPILAQESLKFEQFSVEHGLSQGGINCIIQDSDGFIWAGTQMGLNRFDGHKFRTFRNDPYDSLSLSNNFITSIAEYAAYILIGTEDGMLNIFNKKTEKCFRLPILTQIDPVFAASSSNWMYPQHIYIDGKGAIWLYISQVDGKNSGMYSLETAPNFWQRLPSELNLLQTVKLVKIKEGEIKRFKYNTPFFNIMDNGNPIGSFQKNGWKRFDSEKKVWLPVFSAGDKLPVFERAAFSNNNKGGFWQTEEGDIWFSKSGKPWLQIGKSPYQILLFHDDWLITGKKDSLVVFQIKSDPLSIDLSKPIYSIFCNRQDIFIFDHSGNFWTTKGAEGLLKYRFSSQRFRHYFKGASLMHPPNLTSNGNIYYLRSDEEAFDVNNQPDAELQAVNKEIMRIGLNTRSLRIDSKGQYWALGKCDSLAILLKVDPKTGKNEKRVFPYRLYREQEFAFDENGAIWFATDGRLICFNTVDKTWTSADFQHLDLNKIRIIALQKTADGSWWLGTENGLIQAKPKNNNQFDFQVFKTNPIDSNSPNCNNINSLLTDPNNPFLLWIGTKGGGLNNYNLKTQQFLHLTTKQGLPDDVVYGVLPDEVGNLWLSTNRGLVRYNPTTGAMKNYRQADGLQNDEFNTWAYGKGENGDLMFGGIHGLNVFNPKDLKDNPIKPKTFITALKINDLYVNAGNSDGILTETSAYTKSITVPYTKNNITLEFAALEYTAISKNRFRYYLEGAEKEGAHETETYTATYLNLPLGTYTFKVVGSNNDGIWSDTPAVLTITVLPPWYRTVWAYLVYLLILAGLIYQYWQFKNNEKLMAEEIEEKKRKAEYSEMQLKTVRLEAQYNNDINRLKLEAFTQHLLEKSQTIINLRQQVRDTKNDEMSHNNTPDEIEKLLESAILTQDDWESFKERFDKVFPNFQDRLYERYPQLTTSEIRLLLLVKMGQTNATQTATFLGISTDAVKKARYRLRKKLGISEMLLEDFITDI